MERPPASVADLTLLTLPLASTNPVTTAPLALASMSAGAPGGSESAVMESTTTLMQRPFALSVRVSCT